jgi:hypothetical protein
MNKPIKYIFDFVFHASKLRRIFTSQSVVFNDDAENANVFNVLSKFYTSQPIT